MKYSNSIELLKLLAKALLAPDAIAYDPKRNYFSDYSSNLESNNSMDNNIYAEPGGSNEEYNESDYIENNSNEDRESYNSNKNNGYYGKQKDTSSNPQGVIDSITQELTSVRLQQAIILSEIVGKPRSKTRKKRRF